MAHPAKSYLLPLIKGETTLQKIADELGISRQAVHQHFASQGYTNLRQLRTQRTAALRAHRRLKSHIKRLRGPSHGTLTRYNRGCHCLLCREVNKLHARKYNARIGNVSPFVCAVCGESVWRVGTPPNRTWRHYVVKRHDPVPVARPQSYPQAVDE